LATVVSFALEAGPLAGATTFAAAAVSALSDGVGSAADCFAPGFAPFFAAIAFGALAFVAFGTGGTFFTAVDFLATAVFPAPAAGRLVFDGFVSTFSEFDLVEAKGIALAGEASKYAVNGRCCNDMVLAQIRLNDERYHKHPMLELCAIGKTNSLNFGNYATAFWSFRLYPGLRNSKITQNLARSFE
jgi:hypothetical protein